MLADRVQTFRSDAGFSNSAIPVADDTPKLRYMKKQLMVAMKQHGDGLKHLEAMTLKYGKEMLQKIEDYKGAPFDPAELLITALASIMLTLIYGHTTEEEANIFSRQQKQLLNVFQANGAYLMLDILPILRFIVPSVKKAYAEFRRVFKNQFNLYENYTGARRNLYKHPQVECFIDHFLELSITNKSEEDKSRIIDELNIVTLGSDMFMAGSTTTSKTLQMMLAVLVNYQEIQDKAYMEINAVIGKRNPTMADRPLMPFIEALILETLRYHSLLMYSIPHKARCDAELNGYLIPKGTFIFPNLWSLHHDERYWDQPWEFNPGRFIEDGKVVTPDHEKKQRLLPFGAGRRRCPGEVFARNRLFILICLMLQKFEFISAEGHPLPNDDPRDCHADFILLMKDYKLSANLRQ